MAGYYFELWHVSLKEINVIVYGKQLSMYIINVLDSHKYKYLEILFEVL